ncbi:polyhydroxybutyrate depolymerase [Nonomuraea solani]|uniref:Polyhydroxybutyrate depolymerase n=1 Tax=Nonomuraea solani TaxID=1144553 RepID=A0A1H6EXR9_9ACTN|nr:hypothetical protein [Nonomuraea solani]SEH01434.1 polyhydroxybutyrate depolymerase [Nonomuraea solani]
MPTRLIIVLTAALLAAPRCGAAPPPPPELPKAPARASAGCGAERPLAPGRHTISAGGLKRRFLLSVPTGDGPHPIVLDLHGLNSTAARQAVYSRLPEDGARRGYIVATPQAAPGRMGWTLPHTGGPDDSAFLAALLDHLERGLCADPRREFAAGMSYGAGMATGLICSLDGRLAAVAAVAGLNILPPCDGARPTTIVAFHGTADRIVPYRGGHPFQDATGNLRGLADLVTLAPVERAARGWAKLLGCGGPAGRRVTRQVRLQDWKSCPAGMRLRLYTIDGGGHTWPGSLQVPGLGGTTRDVDATAVILDTFDHAPSR